ncbi:MAG: zinc-dependent metalloprotease [Bifidobacteriaceae bacterium]|jgi:putative hydrolase|nr:zinc-dependent metalloprotease [Bifidobacteriaceae bacterium]
MDGEGTPGDFPPEFVEFLRSLVGDRADGLIEAMRATNFDPRAVMENANLPDTPATRAFLVDKLRRALATMSSKDPVNWESAHELARHVASAGGDPSVSDAQAKQVRDALGVADLWLDSATAFPASGGQALALSSAQWIETTWDAWRRMVGPVATSVADVLANAIVRHQEHAPGEATDELLSMMRAMSAAAFAMQIGKSIGDMSREVMGLTDVGLPLTDPRSTGLLPASIERFADGLAANLDEVRLFLAVREAASARLFTHARWLGPHLLGAVAAYINEVDVDIERIERAVADIDPSDESALREALANGAMALNHTPAQTAALERLETALALVEGWVDEVSRTAVTDRLPHAAGLGEMIRRRRVMGSPAERAFGTLVGLTLRPRRAREAAALWRSVADAEGLEGRESIWSHPDLLPTSADLEDGSTYAANRASPDTAEVDAAIAQLLHPPPPEPDPDPEDGGG